MSTTYRSRSVSPRANRRPTLRRRVRNFALVALALSLMGMANGPVVGRAAEAAYNDYTRSRPAYMQANGHWDTAELPEGFRARSVHAALLHTGEVLLVAGSGNSQKKFDAGSFDTVLWDPVSGDVKNIPTPEDLFCGGHSYLPNGDLLIAGGTKKYEVLEDEITRAAGVLTLKNESNAGPITLPEGTAFTGPGGLQYRSTEDVVVPAAHQMADYSLMAGAANVWIRAEGDNQKYVTSGGKRFTVSDASREESKNLYGTADSITFEKQNYRGLDASYIFDVEKERYVETGRLSMARWYPTLVSINGGNVLAVSGLDQHGRIIDGNNEVFERSQKKWFDKPELNRYFPTYPQLFRLKDGRLFYSGANTGYGSTEEGRTPGIWDLKDNSFQEVPGLRDADMNETATSFLLPPVQNQKVAMVGGGLAGESPVATDRFDVVDLSQREPKFSAATNMASPVRYLNAVTLPDDTVLLTGGSSNYRGKDQSDLHSSRIYDAQSGELRHAAPNELGHNYHATALLLPDGRVMMMGSDPLFSDEDNTMPGVFDTQIEIFTPPYLHTGTPRPEITKSPRAVQRGTTFRVHVETSNGIAKARLMRPSAVTHQTDTEQRSVALDITERCPTGDTTGECCADGCKVDLSLGKQEGITPSGMYILMIDDELGVPSEAAWIRVK